MPRRQIDDDTADHTLGIVVGPGSPDLHQAAHLKRKVDQAVLEILDPREVGKPAAVSNGDTHRTRSRTAFFGLAIERGGLDSHLFHQQANWNSAQVSQLEQRCGTIGIPALEFMCQLEQLARLLNGNNILLVARSPDNSRDRPPTTDGTRFFHFQKYVLESFRPNGSNDRVSEVAGPLASSGVSFRRIDFGFLLGDLHHF